LFFHLALACRVQRSLSPRISGPRVAARINQRLELDGAPLKFPLSRIELKHILINVPKKNDQRKNTKNSFRVASAAVHYETGNFK
jgi:hypothetical protein